MSDTAKVNRRAPDFRYVAVDTVGVSIGENSVKIVCSIEDLDGESLEQIGLVISPSVAKVLGVIINRGLLHQEEVTGRTIYVDQAKMDAVNATFDASKDKEAKS